MFVTSVLIHFNRPLTPNQEGGPHGHFPTVGARKRGANGPEFLVQYIFHNRIEIHLIDVLGDPANNTDPSSCRATYSGNSRAIIASSPVANGRPSTAEDNEWLGQHGGREWKINSVCLFVSLSHIVSMKKRRGMNANRLCPREQFLDPPQKKFVGHHANKQKNLHVLNPCGVPTKQNLSTSDKLDDQTKPV